ncbi:hypothetical protein PG996_010022 [Apiospora saccharicola]|uniref:Uncharacterized protein n=1 Tax=Apiospora saccharicola TaxID=335842 RepID=A0ABR1UMF4_9PEZI
MAFRFIHTPFPTSGTGTSGPSGDYMTSSDKAKKKKKPLAMEPPTSARGPPDRVLFGNPHPGPMQNLDKNRKFEEWRRDVAKWETEERWERDRPKDVIKWREIKW